MKKLKKILFGLVTSAVILMGLSNFTTVNAESAGPMYLGIVSLRSSGYGYTQNGKKVWKIAKYASSTGTTADLSNLIYCIKAGVGFGSDVSQKIVKTYSQQFDLKNPSSISAPYNTVIPTGENYSKLMWIIDHMYTGIGKNNDEERMTFFKNLLGVNEISDLPVNSEYRKFYQTLTDDDMDTIQQLAIWYFTNPGSEYQYDNIDLKINKIQNDDSSEYDSIANIYGTTYENTQKTIGQVRTEAARAYYKYLISTADSTYTTNSLTTTPIKLEKSTATMKKDGSNYVAGPYTIKQIINNVDYTLETSFKDYGTDSVITPKFGVKNSNGEIVETDKNIKQLVGTEFYLIMPTSSNITGIKMTVKSGYSSRKVEYWSIENAPETEQPVIFVTDKPYTFSDEASIVVPKPFDLSLRKFITAINGVETTARIPQVDTSKLKTEESTTAIYNHPKTPIKVSLGDIVTYTIRVYNEGNQDGYAKEVTDYLPEQLEYIPDDETNIQYQWKLSTDMRKISTTYLSKESETTNGSNLITAYNGGDTLNYKELKVKCKVKATNPMVSKITNIAEITDETDANGNKVEDRDSQPKNVNLPTGTDLEDYRNQEISRGEEYIAGQQDDDDFEKLILKEFDLALKKFIVGVNETPVTGLEPTYNTNSLKAGQSTATYTIAKTPVPVTIGDTVIYTIRIYNEGENDGYASEITDYLPEQLEIILDNDITKKYEWTVDSSNSKRIKTSYLAKENDGKKNEFETETRNNKILAYNGGETLSYKDIQVACKVISSSTKIRNVAEISKDTDGEGNEVTDRDSTPDNVKDVPNYDKNQEDDDDYADLKLKEFDLALRKFITGVNDTKITDRIPQPTPESIENLKNGTVTTLEYNHTKKPLKVALGDTIIYTLRIYNEGEISGYASEVTDYLPEQLEFVKDSEINKSYEWVVDSSNSKKISTTYLSKDKESETRKNLINAFKDGKVSYKDLQVECKVVNASIAKKITNLAEITKHTNQNGSDVTDRDSQPGNINIPTAENLPSYKDNESDKKYVPGQQDDDDFEKVQIQEFDLALRKFITAVNSTEVTTRYPVFSIDDKGNYIYTHTKEPVLVTNGAIVTYTIRVFNEGEMDGYAKVVKDDIPEGLEFVQDNETNKEYRWIMLDKDGKETTKVEDAVSITTDYLSKEQEKTSGENLIKAFDESTMKSPDYKDVKVAFRVSNNVEYDRIVENKAQIAEDSDKNGNDVTDKDSTPDEWNDGEDDQDKEYIKVQYFDLSLLKWLTQTIVIENGETTVTETGNTPENDPAAKVEIKKSKLNSIKVKFRYKIRVTNEGQIPGYAKEISDYIPDGLKFDPADNKGWTQIDEKTITTDYAKDILLKPGESTEVEVVLTWINGSDNMGLKVNVAEISEDYNEFGAPDKDSTPGNKVEGEDDQDDAKVLLSVQTGEVQKYLLITGVTLIILASGIVLIKKYVL